MINRLKSINTIPFIFCLGLLFLNDFYLKEAYHNWLTGKLSDFCGLYVFASFWSALLTTQKKWVYFGTALLFILWKSPYAQGVIDLFSDYLYPIHRVVDISDLMAIAILPIAYWLQFDKKYRVEWNPIVPGILTIIAFCATSHPQPRQNFDQPQWLLFKSDSTLENIDSQVWSGFEVYCQDTTCLVKVNDIAIQDFPVLNDDYQKVSVLKNLEVRVLNDLLYGSSIPLETVLDSLTISGETSEHIKLQDYQDSLHFEGIRLHGRFTRYSNKGKLLIDGWYNHGIEDSLWSYYNYNGEVVVEKVFDHGELTRKTIDLNKDADTTYYSKRSEKITYKYFHLAIIAMLIIGLIYWLAHNYKTHPANIKYSKWLNIILLVILPIVVFALGLTISLTLPYSPQLSFLFILEFFVVFLTSLILFIIIFFAVRLRSHWDLLIYVVLFSLIFVLIEHAQFLQELIND